MFMVYVLLLSVLFVTVSADATKNATEPIKMSPFGEVSFKPNLPSVSSSCGNWCPSDHWCSSNGICCPNDMPVACGSSNADGSCCPAGHHCCNGGSCCPN